MPDREQARCRRPEQPRASSSPPTIVIRRPARTRHPRTGPSTSWATSRMAATGGMREARRAGKRAASDGHDEAQDEPDDDRAWPR